MRVLVTGGAGFIGRSLVLKCVEQGHTVSVVDNLRNGRREHLASVEENVTFHQQDILDAQALRAVFDEARPELVFHLAAMHFIPWCSQHPQETIRVNVEGSYSVLTEAARAGVRTCVTASTGAIYPSRDKRLAEDLDVAPNDVYGISKHLMEETARTVLGVTSTSCVAARLFNVYGPCETNQHLIPDILDFLKVGNILRLGNITTRRDYIFVDDVAALLLKLALQAPAGYTTVNVGTGNEYSAEDIIRIIENLRQTRLYVESDPRKRRATDKQHQRADITRLQTLVGHGPRISLEEGLLRLLRHEGLLTVP